MVYIVACAYLAISRHSGSFSTIRHFGFQVKIMKDWDPQGKRGPKMPLPDVVKV